MNNIYSFAQAVTSRASDVFTVDFSNIGHWLGRSIQRLPQQMQQNRNVAFAVFVVANSVFFTLTSFFVKQIDRRIEEHPEELSWDENAFKQVLLSGLCGLSIFVMNDIFAEVMNYPLGDYANAAIALTAISVRLLAEYRKAKKAANIQNG